MTVFEPVFTYSNKLIRSLSEIEAAKAVIDEAALVPAYEKQFREEAVVRSVHFGTRIEGNDLTFQEVAKLVDGRDVNAGERDIQEVINYRNVMSYLEELWSLYDAGMPLPEEKAIPDFANNQRPFFYSETIIKRLHGLTTDKVVNPDQVGRYRHQQVVLKNTKTGEVAHRPPPAIEVPYLMEDFIDWINSKESRETHSVIRAAIATYILIAIHGFVDGNGRISRAFGLLVLYAEGYDIRRLFSLEEHFDRNIEDYYNNIQKVHDTNPDPFKRNLTPWIEYYALSLSIELNRLRDKVKTLSRDMKLKQKLGGKQVQLTERQVKLIEFMQQFGGLRMPDAKQILPMVSDDTIWRDLKKLVEDGVVEKRGSTKGAFYCLVNA